MTRITEAYPVRRLTSEEIPQALELCWRVFLEFEAPDAAAIQVVLAEGKAVPLHEEDGAMVYAIPVETMSGRRYFLPDD